jgi:hypothetical protein
MKRALSLELLLGLQSFALELCRALYGLRLSLFVRTQGQGKIR